MATILYLKIDNDTTNGTTGHRDWDLRICERDSVTGLEVSQGPVTTRGVDTATLMTKYGACGQAEYERFLVEIVKPEMITTYNGWKLAQGTGSMNGMEL